VQLVSGGFDIGQNFQDLLPKESGAAATHLALSRVVLHKYTQFGRGYDKLRVAANCADL
jgi:hypothetical protein